MGWVERSALICIEPMRTECPVAVALPRCCRIVLRARAPDLAGFELWSDLAAADLIWSGVMIAVFWGSDEPVLAPDASVAWAPVYHSETPGLGLSDLSPN